MASPILTLPAGRESLGAAILTEKDHSPIRARAIFVAGGLQRQNLHSLDWQSLSGNKKLADLSAR